MKLGMDYGLGNDMTSIFGMKVIVSPDRPKYELPSEVIPGVPWPPGFRESINAWALDFFGTRNAVPEGRAFIIENQFVIMRPKNLDILKMLT